MIILKNLNISIISPKDILKLASKKLLGVLHVGEVYIPDTINYKTGLPVRGGLFCEKIFGPTLNWKCGCPTVIKKYQHICTNCGCEVNSSYIRRLRMGVIYLHTPIFHPWYFNSRLSILPILLDSTYENFINLIYYKYCQIFTTHKNVIFISNTLKHINLTQSIYINLFIQKYLDSFNILENIFTIKEVLLIKKNTKNNSILCRKLFFLNLFFFNKLNMSWLILNTFPIIPPDLRPVVRLNQYSFIVSNLNNFYKNILIHNNRLKVFSTSQSKIPISFTINEKINLQKAIDLLFNKNTKYKTVDNLILKSLSGKYGKFRQNLLGKRLDYSSRSVIISGPDLLFSQVGVPMSIACNLFMPLVVHLFKKHKTLKYIVDNFEYINMSSLYRRVLTRILKKTSILLNRAPTLHRVNIQGFRPYLIEGSSIKIYPLVCSSFNADFDGDQMSMLLTMTKPSRLESKYILSSDKNFLSVSTGLNLFKLNQTIILGLFFMSTLNYKNNKGHCLYFNTFDDLTDYYIMKFVELHTLVWVRVIIFNSTSLLRQNYFHFSSAGRLILIKSIYCI